MPTAPAPAAYSSLPAYWSAIAMRIPGLLFSSYRLVFTIPAIVFFLGRLISPQLDERWSDKFATLSPWWTALPIFLLIVWGVMQAIYERDQQLYEAFKTASNRNLALERDILRLQDRREQEEYRRQYVIIADLYIEYNLRKQSLSASVEETLGITPLPKDWVEQRLTEMGETFRWPEYRLRR